MPPKLPLQKSGPRNRPDLRLFQQFCPGIYAAEGGSSDSPTSGLGFQVSNPIEKPTAQTGGREFPKPKAVKSNLPGRKPSSSHTFTSTSFHRGTNRDPPKSPASSPPCRPPEGARGLGHGAAPVRYGGCWTSVLAAAPDSAPAPGLVKSVSFSACGPGRSFQAEKSPSYSRSKINALLCIFSG